MFHIRAGKKFFDNNFKSLIKQGKNTMIVALVNGKLISELMDDTGTTLLHLSARYNNLEVTKFLINSGCNVNVRNTMGLTPLMMAATASSFKTAQFLLDENADMYSVNPANKCSLQLLLSNKKAPRYIIDKCFERVKSISRSNQELAGRLLAVECPLKSLIYLHNAEVLGLILQNSSKIDPQQAQLALDTAMRLKEKAAAKVLLLWGVDVNIRNPDALQFLGNMFKHPGEVDYQLLITFLMRIKNWDELEESYLFFLEGIFECATKEALEIFFYYNIDVIVKNKFPGRDLIVHLFANQNPGVRDLFKTRKFNVHSTGEKGITALHLAVKFASIDDIKYLLDMGADPNAEDSFGTTPLCMITHNGSSKKRTDCIELLLKYGADPQAIDFCSGTTLIDLAIKTSDLNVLEPILAQIAVLQVSGKPIKQQLSGGIQSNEQIKAYYQSCCMQLETLKNYLIYGSVTLFTVIAEDIERIALRIPYPQIIESLRQTTTSFQWHTLYRSRMDEFFHLTLEIISLRSKAYLVLRDAIPPLGSEDIIVKRILCYFTHEDLQMFA